MNKKKLTFNILMIISAVMIVAIIVILLVTRKEATVPSQGGINDPAYVTEVTDLNERITELDKDLNEKSYDELHSQILELVDEADARGSDAQQVNARYIQYRLYMASNRTRQAIQVVEELLDRQSLNEYDRIAFVEEAVTYYRKDGNQDKLKKYLQLAVDTPDEIYEEWSGSLETKEEHKQELEALK